MDPNKTSDWVGVTQIKSKEGDEAKVLWGKQQEAIGTGQSLPQIKKNQTTVAEKSVGNPPIVSYGVS